MNNQYLVNFKLTRYRWLYGKSKALLIVTLILALTICAFIPAAISAATGTFGNTGNGTNTGGLVDVLIATKYTLTEDAVVNQIGGYAATAGNWKLGIYSDNGGLPGTLLAANNNVNPVVAGSNTFSIGPVFLTAGTYWLAILTDTANRRYESGAANQASYIIGYGFSNSLPASFGTPTGTQNNDYVEFASYSTAIPTTITVACDPPVVPSSGSLDTTISGTLTLASDGETGISGKTITISYHDGTTWNTILTVTTDINGVFSETWTVPSSLPNGFYPVKAVFSGDSTYGNCEAVTSSDSQGILMLPEYVVGILGALAICITGFVLYKKGVPSALKQRIV